MFENEIWGYIRHSDCTVNNLLIGQLQQPNKVAREGTYIFICINDLITVVLSEW